jgi:outer membrane protein assembly factor BamE
MKNIRISLAAALILTLSGCSWFEGYRPPVQQGSVVDSQALTQLKLGMSKAQVRFIMGDPLLVDTFDPNRWDYTYYDQPSFGKTTTKHLTLYFANQQLARIVKGAAHATAQ